LRLALDLRPDFPAAQFMLATLLEQNREFAEAEKIYRTINEKSVFYRKGLLRIALNDDEQGKTDRALALLDTLQKDDEDGYTVLLTRAEILRNHKRFDEAIAAYSAALGQMQKVENYYWPIIYARGICYEHAGKWELAEKDFQHALTLEPDQPDILNYLGYSWLVMGKNIPEAKDMISRAIEQRPNDPHIIDSMGWALFGMGDFAGAVKYLERALNLAPEDATVNEHLGDAYWRSNRKVEARYQWERALVYDQTPKVAEAVRAKIQNGLPPVIQMKQAERQSKPTPSSSGVLTVPAKQ
jgi:tetratricopeptide (TPR) repeat protein